MRYNTKFLDTGNAKSVLLVASNLLFLVIISTYTFSNAEYSLFQHYDGISLYRILKEQFTWTSPSFSMPFDPYQGLVNINGINFWFSLPGLISYFIDNHEPSKVAFYCVVTLEVFVATWLLSRSIDLNQRISLFASWVASFFIMPFSSPPYFFCIAYNNPYVIEMVASTTAATALIIFSFRIFSNKGASTTIPWLLLAAYALLFTNFLYVTLLITLFFPWLIAQLLAHLPKLNITSMYRKIKINTTATFVIITLLFLSACASLFYVGLAVDTVSSIFLSELHWNRDIASSVSLLYYSINSPLGKYSSIIFILSLLGSIMTLFSHNTSPFTKSLAKAYLAYEALILLFGLYIQHIKPNYSGLAPLYFEWCVWPAMFIFATISAAFFYKFMCRSLSWLRNIDTKLTNKIALPGISAFFILTILIISTFNTSSAFMIIQYRDNDHGIINSLSNSIGLHPGLPFRGSVASFIGYDYAKSSSGLKWPELIGKDFANIKAYGNDYRGPGLWMNNIPTLFEYNQELTPQYYYALSRFFSRPSDQQTRTIVVMSRPKLRLLALLGVRFVLTESDLENYDVSASDMTRVKTSISPTDNPKSPFYMYELLNANTGNYSPTDIQQLNTASEQINYMNESHFDPQKTVVVNETTVIQPLVPADGATLVFNKNEMSVQAKSSNYSLIVLPVQYSHCIELCESTTTASPARILRVDFLLTGILFKNELNCQLKLNYNPFTSPFCRIEDYLDMKAMKIGQDVGPSGFPVGS